MSEFNLFVDELLDVNEGGAYTPDDCGRGPSRWGITLATYRHWDPGATADTIRDMTRDEAAYFYQWQYGWEPLKIGAIRSQDLAEKVFDLQVNTGHGIKFLQQAVGVAVDGRIGPITIVATNALAPDIVLRAMYYVGKDYYDADVAAHPEKQKFYDGWIARLKKGIPLTENL